MADRVALRAPIGDRRILPSPPPHSRLMTSLRWRRLRPWAALALACVVALWLFGEAIVRLPWRPINEVAVIGTLNVAPDVIRDAAQVNVGAPMFSVHVDSVIARVRTVPWLLDAQVTRRLSGRFEIHVLERVPVGVIWDGRYHLLDGSGYSTLLDGKTPPDVPLVTGFRFDAANSERELANLGWALRVVADLEPLRSVVSEVSLADSAVMVMFLSPDGTPVLLPRRSGRDRFVTVASVVASHPEVVRRAHYLDARFAGHVAVSS